jgi:hypothetical protein
MCDLINLPITAQPAEGNKMTIEYKIINTDDDIVALLGSLEPTAPPVELSGARIHTGIVFGAETIYIELNDGTGICIG